MNAAAYLHGAWNLGSKPDALSDEVFPARFAVIPARWFYP